MGRTELLGRENMATDKEIGGTWCGQGLAWVQCGHSRVYRATASDTEAQI